MALGRGRKRRLHHLLLPGQELVLVLRHALAKLEKYLGFVWRQLLDALADFGAVETPQLPNNCLHLVALLRRKGPQGKGLRGLCQ